MAFVFKSDRPCLGLTKSPFPGPGHYTSDEKPPIDVNPVPFLSSAQRSSGQKPDKTPVPGPGTYIAPVSVQSYNTKTKTLYSAVNPEMPALLEQKSSSTFSSGTIRFPKQKEAEAPGPGAYELPPAIMTVKGMSQTGHAMGASLKNKDKYNNEKPGRGNQGVLKAAVPSIPSVIHSYGYTEAETKELTLNNNPLLEIQKFVGPGYYDVPTANDYNKPKGISWTRSKVQRGFNPELAVSTATLGPGAYKPKAKVYLPLYKFKPSAGFSSKSTRSISDKDRVRAERKKKQALKKADTNLMENPNPEQDSELDAGMTPGPGYYHNTAAASSFKQTFKAPQHQFFGSGGERFDNSIGAKTTVGPGRYNIRKEFSKKVENESDVKVPFSTNVQRFVDHKTDIPGPGSYQAGQGERKLGANENNIERFGVLETRFKHDFEGTPGPGTYYNGKEQVKNKDEKGAKTSHMFTSASKREAFRADNIDGPAPGAYNVGYYDVATKAKKIEDEDVELSLKRVPFNSNVERFRQPVSQIEERHEDGFDEEDSFDEGWNVDGPDRGDLILKARKQPKISSSFASKTQRKGLVANPKEKSIVPGPGKYNAGGPDDWIKKTYNVNFTAD